LKCLISGSLEQDKGFSVRFIPVTRLFDEITASESASAKRPFPGKSDGNPNIDLSHSSINRLLTKFNIAILKKPPAGYKQQKLH
jgi:hypothetical protein